MSNDGGPPVDTSSVIMDSLMKGCLGGLGLLLLFVVISVITYFLTGSLQENVRLLLTFASGPIIGTILVFLVLTVRSMQMAGQYSRGER